MKLPALPIEGGCRCGRLRFRINARPLFTGICHCAGCQRMSASAFSTTVCVPESGFELLSGDPVIGGLHGDQIRHHHCDWCKSWVFTRFEPSMGFVNVRATMLDDASWFEPFVETCTDEALPWAVLASVPYSYAKFPEMSEYEPVLAAFAEACERD